ncbi:CotH kinase family protein [Pseudalkalibacillus hwajinpoensis]|uniref:Spore coat protein n=1 Tax=Guptibacillus hwajinpoensis TaxID=208199 RepID=A0A4U1MHI4_9BACL|nr:CotH kinase family protein [Pseudalkalibacillus hwajinpoensis]TKD70453.1 spore coat protein [Pseudalkalibacillus hwajinpoensis]
MKIPEYKLLIDAKGLKKLNKEKWNDRLVPATLKVGDRDYSVNTGYRGAHTRKLKKKSFEVEFDKPEAFHDQKTIHLNAEYNDYSLLRSKLSFDLFSKLQVLTPKSEHIILTLNDLYKSIYLKLDSIDEYYLINNSLPEGGIFYAQNDDANFSLIRPDDYKPKRSLMDGYKRKFGSDEDDVALQVLIYKINTLKREDFVREANNLIDVEKYINWLCGVVCTQNFDAFIQNYALYRNRATGRFEVIPWDYDATWGRDINGRLMEYDYIPITGYNTLTARILDCPSLKEQYRERMDYILETIFTEQALEPEIRKHHQTLRPYVMEDSFQKTKLGYFDSEPEFILTYIRDRRAYLQEELTRLT